MIKPKVTISLLPGVLTGSDTWHVTATITSPEGQRTSVTHGGKDKAEILASIYNWVAKETAHEWLPTFEAEQRMRYAVLLRTQARFASSFNTLMAVAVANKLPYTHLVRQLEQYAAAYDFDETLKPTEYVAPAQGAMVQTKRWRMRDWFK